MKNDVNDGAVEHQGREPEFSFQSRDNFDSRDQPIYMRVRNLARGLAPMDGEVPYFNLETEWYGVESAQIHTPARDPLQLGHQATPDQRLEGICRRVPTQATEQQQPHKSSEQQIVAEPAPARLGAGFVHRN